jgi:hypothetical protein
MHEKNYHEMKRTKHDEKIELKEHTEDRNGIGGLVKDSTN